MSKLTHSFCDLTQKFPPKFRQILTTPLGAVFPYKDFLTRKEVIGNHSLTGVFYEAFSFENVKLCDLKPVQRPLHWHSHFYTWSILGQVFFFVNPLTGFRHVQV